MLDAESINPDPKHCCYLLGSCLQKMKECLWLDRPAPPPIGGHNFPVCVQGSPGGSVGGRRHLQASREQRARRSGRYQAAHFLRQVPYNNIRISRIRLFSLICSLNLLSVLPACYRESGIFEHCTFYLSIPVPQVAPKFKSISSNI